MGAPFFYYLPIRSLRLPSSHPGTCPSLNAGPVRREVSPDGQLLCPPGANAGRGHR
jgi:hypothetical protein